MLHCRLAARRLLTLALALAVMVPVLGSVASAQASAAAVGMQLHVLWGDITTAEAERQVQQAADAGANVVRIDVGWASIEGDGKGQWSEYHLNRLDKVVAAAEARGIKPLLGLADSPCWASSAPDSERQGCTGAWWDRDVTHYLPRNADDYADALTFLARRYGTRVAGLEMWNEPNLDFFNRGADKAGRYAELVKVAYAKAKAAAPGVTFIAGSLSESDTDFTEALYRAGIKGSFDAFSIHPYCHDVSPTAARTEDLKKASFARGVPAVHDAMVRNGDDKPLWLTEFGWSTNTVRGANAWENGVDEATQAVYVRQALDLVRSWSYVPVAIYYGMKDMGANRSDMLSNYGLTHTDGSAKPALAAFRTAAADRSPLPPVATPAAASDATATAVNAVAEVAPKQAPSTTTATERAARLAVAKRVGARASAARALAVSVARRSVVRVRGQAPGTRKVTLMVRRVVAHGASVKVSHSRALRLLASVTKQGRFDRTFSTARFARGSYVVTLAGGGNGPRPSAKLVVR